MMNDVRAWFTVNEINEWAEKKLEETSQLTTEQPAQQEPALTYDSVMQSMYELYTGTREQKKMYEALKDRPLYTSPPAREWVGLTDGERAECNYDNEGFMVGRDEAICKVEAKLREKNGYLR